MTTLEGIQLACKRTLPDETSPLFPQFVNQTVGAGLPRDSPCEPSSNDFNSASSQIRPHPSG